ncbi:HDOD domain-containing protein [Granulosicoccus sp. 3-233]|uniref:HDOD domain-containing protein n=1 Tax=Granulosicoccus sp. 3-233 TaxID=3417969 RepID=UPI003D347C63
MTSGADESGSVILAAAAAVSPVSELNASNREALCKTATVVHVQRNDQIKPENSHRWLMYLVDGSLNLYSGKDEVGVINANTSEALQPLFQDKGAYQSARTSTVARIVRFGREQLSILLKEQQKNAISVMDVQVGEDDNVVFDDIVAAIKSRNVTLASSRDAATRILAAYKQVGGIPELAEVIQSDPGLAVHIVRVANSIDAASSDATSSIRGAITRMGVEETQRNLSELLQRNTMIPANEVIGKRLRRYIQRTRLSSAIVQVLAREVPHLKPEVAMMVALTADVGELLILTHANQHADRFNDEEQLAGVIDKLRVIVSSWLIADWDFPVEFIDACQTARDWYRNHNGEITYTDLVTAALLIIQSEMPEPKQSSIPSANNLLLARRLQQAGIDLTTPGEIVKAATGRLVTVEALLKAS